jgi:hypothetical protein
MPVSRVQVRVPRVRVPVSRVRVPVSRVGVLGVLVSPVRVRVSAVRELLGQLGDLVVPLQLFLDGLSQRVPVSRWRLAGWSLVAPVEVPSVGARSCEVGGVAGAFRWSRGAARPRRTRGDWRARRARRRRGARPLCGALLRPSVSRSTGRGARGSPGHACDVAPRRPSCRWAGRAARSPGDRRRSIRTLWRVVLRHARCRVGERSHPFPLPRKSIQNHPKSIQNRSKNGLNSSCPEIQNVAYVVAQGVSSSCRSRS